MVFTMTNPPLRMAVLIAGKRMPYTTKIAEPIRFSTRIRMLPFTVVVTKSMDISISSVAQMPTISIAKELIKFSPNVLIFLVWTMGLEPIRCYSQAPQTCASAIPPRPHINYFLTKIMPMYSKTQIEIYFKFLKDKKKKD